MHIVCKCINKALEKLTIHRQYSVKLNNLHFLLKEGIHDFPPGAFGSTDELRRCAALHQKRILLLACSEQGGAPDSISFAKTGSFLILQHLAASVPSKLDCEHFEGHSFNAIEKLIFNYDFRHVIVCGHLGCEVIRHWLQPAREGESDVGNFRRRFNQGTRKLVDSHYLPNNAEERISLMVCEHVLCQIDNMLTHSSIMARVKAKRTFFHGWVTDDESARVLGYCPNESAFALI